MRKILGASLLLSGASSALALPQLKTDASPASPIPSVTIDQDASRPQLETDAIPASPSSLLPAEDILDTIYPVATPYQTCTIDTATGRHNCRGDIQVVPTPSPISRPQARVKVNLDGQGIWRSVTLRYRTCSADGWTWHIGDSPTNNGYAGDGRSTQHDAEAQSLNRKLMVYASDIGGSGLTCQFPGPATAPEGCVVQQVTVSEDYLRFNPAVNYGAPVSQCGSPYLFDFPKLVGVPHIPHRAAAGNCVSCARDQIIVALPAVTTASALHPRGLPVLRLLTRLAACDIESILRSTVCSRPCSGPRATAAY